MQLIFTGDGSGKKKGNKHKEINGIFSLNFDQWDLTFMKLLTCYFVNSFLDFEIVIRKWGVKILQNTQKFTCVGERLEKYFK